MGMMTATPLCQLLSFTIGFCKTNWVSALNGHLVSAGPARRGLEECSHWEAWPCWRAAQDMALHPLLLLWRSHISVGLTMSCPPKASLIMIRPVLPPYSTDQSCSFTRLAELCCTTLRAWGRSTKSFPSHRFHYCYLPICIALPGSRRGRDAAPSQRRTDWTLMISLDWLSGAKHIWKEEKGAWDEEETEPLKERTKQSDSRERERDWRKIKKKLSFGRRGGNSFLNATSKGEDSDFFPRSPTGCVYALEEIPSWPWASVLLLQI